MTKRDTALQLAINNVREELDEAQVSFDADAHACAELELIDVIYAAVSGLAAAASPGDIRDYIASFNDRRRERGRPCDTLGCNILLQLANTCKYAPQYVSRSGLDHSDVLKERASRAALGLRKRASHG